MRQIIVLCLSLLLAACNNLVEPSRTHVAQYALPVEPQAALPQMVAKITPVEVMKKPRVALADMLHHESSQSSGIYPLIDGVEAFAVRNALIKNTQHSLDLQYYSLQRGLSSRLLIRELVHAADRGVRVRILIDDMDMLGRDHEMTVLSAHKNIEVRIFNPIRRFRGTMLTRIAMFAVNLPTQHRRMHNKVWLADGVLAITGGRNIADRYFNAGDQENFSDMDVLLSGSVVAQVRTSFDEYWNSSQTFPVEAFEKNPDGSVADIQKMIFKINTLTRKERVAHHPYLTALNQAEKQILPQVLPQLTWGEVEFVVDSPDKITQPAPHFGIDIADSRSVPFNKLVPYIQNAQKEVLIISPYFVPGDGLTELLGQLVKKGVRVAVLSNSLESNDVPLVNGPYGRYRKTLLQLGVEMYELRGFPDVDKAPQWRLPIFSWRGSRAALHTKAVVVDGTTSFVGSMNLDPRSIVWNTETGVITAQKPFADKVRTVFVNATEPRYSYHVTLDAKGRLLWSSPIQGMSPISREPGNFWRRLLRHVGVSAVETFL